MPAQTNRGYSGPTGATRGLFGTTGAYEASLAWVGSPCLWAFNLYMSYSQYSGFRMDMGFCIGTVLRVLLKSLHRILTEAHILHII